MSENSSDLLVQLSLKANKIIKNILLNHTQLEIFVCISTSYE